LGISIVLVLILGVANWIALRHGWLPSGIAGLEARIMHRLGFAQTGALSLAAATVLTGSAFAGAAVPPTSIGINLTPPKSYLHARSFANLAIGGEWLFDVKGVKGWHPAPPDALDTEGNLIRTPAGGAAYRNLVMPDTGPAGVVVRCTYSGHGTLSTKGQVRTLSEKPGELRFLWVNDWTKASDVKLRLQGVQPGNPVRQIDCREETMSRDARFDPAFVRSLQEFSVIRFMDWQNTNANAAATWATRHTPAGLNVTDGAGVSVEDMVSLTKLVGADPWFTVPWNADDDYIERFARYVHDNVPAQRKIYVELGNEVWNTRFRVTQQAIAEGQARGFSDLPAIAGAMRYGQRTSEVMAIWTRVFADDPRRLVRVVATQNGSQNNSVATLNFENAAQYVDALATAPYFGHMVGRRGGTRDPDAIYAQMGALVEATITSAEKSKAIAAKYGKRYISYEGGQHIVIRDDQALAEKIQRDPRMYDAYRAYVGAWRARIGDLLTLYADVGPIQQYGAWGLVEHSGQPVGQAPKLRAVRDELRR
jgi:hypothetical protein